jgi:hypothetical protein
VHHDEAMRVTQLLSDFFAPRLVIIDAGHFIWEEESAKYASAVLDSIAGSRP